MLRRSILTTLILVLILAPAATAGDPLSPGGLDDTAVQGRPDELVPPVPVSGRVTTPFTVRIAFDADLSRDRVVSDPDSYGVTGPYVVATVFRTGPREVLLLLWPAHDGIPVASTGEEDLRVSLQNLLYGTAGPEDAGLLQYLLENGLPPATAPVGSVMVLGPITADNGAALTPPLTVPPAPLHLQTGCVADALVDGGQTDPVFVQICESGIGFQQWDLDASESTPETGGTILTWDWAQIVVPCLNPLDTDPPGAPDCIFEQGIILPDPVEDITDPDAITFPLDTGLPLPYLLQVQIADDLGCTDDALLTLLVLPLPTVDDDPPLVDDGNGDGNGILCNLETLTFSANVTDGSTLPTDNLEWWWDFDLATDSDGDTIPDNDRDQEGATPSGLLSVDDVYAVHGSYTARLTIRDADSGILVVSQDCDDSAEVTVDLAEAPAAAAGFAGPAPTCEGDSGAGTEIFLDGSGTDPGGGLPSFRWTTTDGAFRNSGTQESLLEDPILDLAAGVLAADLTLEVSGTNGCAATDVLSVSLDPAPEADAKASGDPLDENRYEVCESGGGDVTIPLDGLATDPDGGQPTILWQTSAGTFQDTGTNLSSLEDPVLVLPAGTLSADLDLTVTSSVGGCVSTDTATATVLAAALAEAGGPHETCGPDDVPVTVDLDASGTVPFDPATQTYLWEVVSGTATLSGATTATPRLILPPGTGAQTVTVRLTVTDANGCSSADTTDVDVFAAPVADAGPTYGACEGESILMDGTAAASSGGAIQVEWTTTVTGAGFIPAPNIEDPELSIPTGAPDGTVTLEVREQVSANMTCTASSTAGVWVGLYPEVDAGGPYRFCGGGTFPLDGVATGSGRGNLSVLWTSDPPGAIFSPSATVAGASLKVPPGTEPQSGILTLTASERRGGSQLICSVDDTATLTLLGSPMVVVDGEDSLCPGATFHGSATVTGGSPPYGILWNFGDGTTATGVDVSHVYPNDAVYLVTATATDAEGCAGMGSLVVDVYNPRIAFTHDAPQCARAPIRFDGIVRKAEPPVTAHWDFGDGTTSVEMNPVHAYAVGGTYTVRFSVRDARGCLSKVEQEVQVIFAPTGEIVHDGPACAGDPILLGVVPQGYHPVLWDFDDGTTGSGNPISHTWDTPGDYFVRSSFTDAFGCTGTAGTILPILDVVLEPSLSGIEDTFHGNGNGYADRGELVNLRVSVRNEGTDTAPGVQVRILGLLGPAQIIQDVDGAGNLLPGQAGVAFPSVLINQTASCDAVVTVLLEASTSYGHCASMVEATFRIGAPVPWAPDSNREVTTESVGSRMPSLVRGEGLWEIAWSDERARQLGAGEEIITQRLTDEGLLFGLPEQTSQTPGESQDASLAWNGKRRTYGVAWTDDASGGNDVWFRNLDFRGIPAGPTVNLTPQGGGSQWGVLLAADDGFLLVWEDWRSTAPHVMIRRFNISGAPVGTAHDVTGRGEHRRPAAALGPDGTVAIAWEYGPEVAFRLFDAVTGAPRSSIQRPARSNAKAPAVVWAGDHYAMAWRDEHQKKAPTIYAVGFDTGGLRIRVPVEVAGSLGATGTPALGSDGEGNVLIAWTAAGRVSAAGLGSAGVLGSGIQLSETGNAASDPVVAWAADIGVYMVGWAEQRFWSTEIFVRRVFPERERLCDSLVPPPMPMRTGTSGLRLRKTAGGEILASWDDGGEDSSYRLYQGRLDVLGLLGYLHQADVCSQVPEVSTGEPGRPGSFHYLVSTIDALGREGPLGFADLDGDGRGDHPRPPGFAACP